MILKTRKSGGEAGKIKLRPIMALHGHGSYLLCYKMATICLGLSLIMLGLQCVTAIIVASEMRQDVIKIAIVIGIFLIVFRFWIKPAIEYYWEMARKLSDKNELEKSLNVRFYRVAVKCFWQTFVGWSKVWTGYVLVITLFGIGSGGMIIALMILEPTDNVVMELARNSSVLAICTVAIQMLYCRLAYRVVVLAEEEEEEKG